MAVLNLVAHKLDKCSKSFECLIFQMTRKVKKWRSFSYYLHHVHEQLLRESDLDLAYLAKIEEFLAGFSLLSWGWTVEANIMCYFNLVMWLKFLKRLRVHELSSKPKQECIFLTKTYLLGNIAQQAFVETVLEDKRGARKLINSLVAISACMLLNAFRMKVQRVSHFGSVVCFN